MTGIRIIHDIDDLANDLVSIAKRVRPEMREVVRESIKEGNKLAKGYASQSNPPGSHSYQYPSKFSTEMHSGLSGEYGPRHEGQGMLAGILEDGQGANAPQNNMRKSADVIGVQFVRKVGARVDRWFW